MYLRIVTFGITVSHEQYLVHADAVAPAFTDWDGLHAKWWLADAGTGVYGGVYLFRDRAAADASRTSEAFRAMIDSPGLTGITITEYDVLDGPTAVTAPPLATATTSRC